VLGLFCIVPERKKKLKKSVPVMSNNKNTTEENQNKNPKQMRKY
jgi:hypothetical protein